MQLAGFGVSRYEFCNRLQSNIRVERLELTEMGIGILGVGNPGKTDAFAASSGEAAIGAAPAINPKMDATGFAINTERNRTICGPGRTKGFLTDIETDKAVWQGAMAFCAF